MAKMHGRAERKIKFGQLVLCRGGRVVPAPKSIANGFACAPPDWDRRKHYSKNEWLFVDPVEGLGERDLQALANAPIMDSNRLYLPAGKVSEAEYQQRLFADFERAGIERNQ
jgi:hypothetical protein